MKTICQSCNGRGWGVWSCCTGDPVDHDIMMCPKCYEHLGEETCGECDGTGEVEEQPVQPHYVRESYRINQQPPNN